VRRAVPPLLLVLGLIAALPAGAACSWQEPDRTYAAAEAWRCQAVRWADGDTFTATCAGQDRPIRIRVRGVDTVERGDPRWQASREELRRRTEGLPLTVRPHHDSRDRVVADVLSRDGNVGRVMDARGWSKASCPRR
jgi:endonuclease YncB( thermonuclease family)